MQPIVRTLLAGAAVCIAAPAPAQTMTALRTVNAARQASVLDLPARLVVEDVPLPFALERLRQSSGVVVAFSPSLLPQHSPDVTCQCETSSVGEALDRMLVGTPIAYTEMHGNIVVHRKSTTSLKQAEPTRTVLASVETRVVPLAEGWLPARPRLQAPTTGTIAGQLTDASTNQPIRWANVRIDGTRRGTTTDLEGRYRLEHVPVGTHTVTGLMLGYGPQSKTVTVAAGETALADFALELSAVRLDEVIVTATGAQRRAELGHVVGSIRADSLMGHAPVTRLSDLLGARVAGLQIVANSGLTGESPRIRIRGLGSINRDRDPLLYVDGIRVDNSPGTRSALGGLLPGRMNDLNADQIESIEVIKGPSAATLYGTDAANGVILVRTKQGQLGPARWDIYMGGGWLRPVTSFDDDSYNSYYSWGTNTATGQSQRCELLQMTAGACSQDSLTVFNPLRHPETTPIGTGTRSQLGIQVSGGVGQGTYFLSGDYEQETGYLRIPALELERLTDERGGGEVPVPTWQQRPNALVQLSLRGSLATNVGSNANLRMSTGLLFRETRIGGSTIFQSANRGPGYRDANDGWVVAGLARGRPGEMFAVKAAEEVARYTASLSANWRPLEWLSTRATVGTDLASAYEDALQRPGEGPAAGRVGRRSHARTNVALYTVDVGASVVTPLVGQVGSRSSIGAQYNRRRHLRNLTSATGLPPGSETAAGAAFTHGEEGQVESVVAGAYFENMFSVNDRLFLTGAVRMDGGSTFGENFRTAIYPKVGGSWILSQEPFFPATPAIDRLRVRLAYGQSGVQPGTTDHMDLVTRFSGLVDGVQTSAAALGRTGNPDLKPERQREIEGGFDVQLFEGRINAEATYYHRLSTDALIAEPLAPSWGGGTRWTNVGSVSNRGYEATLEVQPYQSAALTWHLLFNGSVNHNRLERLGIPGVTSLGSVQDRHQEGFPLFSRWSRPILGYSDTNGNGIIEPNEVEVGDTMVYIGAALPPRQLTTSTAWSFPFLKGHVHLSSLFDYRGGHVTYNGTAFEMCQFNHPACRARNDPDAPLQEQARWVAYTAHGAFAGGYIEDGSFVRWRELAVTYRVSPLVARRLGASELSLNVSSRNLRLWTNYSGADPETQASGFDAIIDGYSGGAIAPPARYWLVRLDARF